MGTIASAALAIPMIAALLLIAGGIKLAASGEHRKQGLLMILAALVLVGNVLIWTL